MHHLLMSFVFLLRYATSAVADGCPPLVDADSTTLCIADNNWPECKNISHNMECVQCGGLRPEIVYDNTTYNFVWTDNVPIESVKLSCEDTVACKCNLTLNLQEKEIRNGKCRGGYSSTECLLEKKTGCQIGKDTKFHGGPDTLECGGHDPPKCTVTDRPDLIKSVTAICTPKKIDDKFCEDCQLHLDYAKRYSCNFDWTSQTFIANADDLCHIDGDLIANVTCVDRPCDDFHYDATCSNTDGNITCQVNASIKRRIREKSIQCIVSKNKTCEACYLMITTSALKIKPTFIGSMLSLLLLFIDRG
ncbi:uncharacterized protein LOC111260733 [Varroa jacobsoni]|uniref:uncharacterized protein LOC111260733 n=1 Tax=Varroa jacobsoni TaxID=62625 RepID=UPI000BF6D371|nr:uncharacterized protein LOC111260733 [Varroa jacobsoni]